MLLSTSQYQFCVLLNISSDFLAVRRRRWAFNAFPMAAKAWSSKRTCIRYLTAILCTLKTTNLLGCPEASPGLCI